MKLLGLLSLALAAVAGAQTPLSPLWTRPAFNVIEHVDVNLPTSRTLVVSSNDLTVFPKGSSIPLWHIRTTGEQQAGFSPDGSIIILSSPTLRPRVFDAATGAFLRYLSGDTSVIGRVLFIPAGANSPFLPAGADVLVSAIGWFRVSDGTKIKAQNLSLGEHSAFSASGQVLVAEGNGQGITDLDPNSTWGSAGGNGYQTISADGQSEITVDGNTGQPIQVRVTDFHTLRQFTYPTGFVGESVHRLGNGTRYAILGEEPVNGVNVGGVIVIDTATGHTLDHRKLNLTPDPGYASQANKVIVDEGDSGYLVGDNAAGGLDRDVLIEVALDASGRSSTPTILGNAPRSQDLLSTGPNDAGLLATGSQNFSSSIELLDGATGGFTRRIARRPVSSLAFPLFSVSPSGRFIFFNGLTLGDSTIRLAGAAVPGGGILNESDAYQALSLFPLADDTLLGYATTPEGTFNARVTRTGSTFKTYRNYTDAGDATTVGASADGKSFLVASSSQLQLFDASTGKQTAYTLWDDPAMDSEDVQVAMDGEGFVVVALRGYVEAGQRVYLDVRRYARQGNVLTLLSSPWRRSYFQRRPVNGVTVFSDIHFRLSPDGRAVWVNYQGTDSSVKPNWTADYYRTSDGALLSEVNDPNFDYGATATAIDPLNRRGYLSRQDGTIQAVPLANALGSILSATQEVVGGTRAVATFRLLRASDGTVSYTAVPTGLALDSTTVTFNPGDRDVQVGFIAPTTSTAQDATIKVNDALGNVATKIRIVPPHLVSALFAMPAITGGDPIDLDLNLDGPAPAGGRTILLTDNSSYLLTPSSVVVPEGATTVRLNIATKKVPRASLVTLTARLDGKAVRVQVTLNP